jgi:leucyl aminopeptidase (aminopeptidase T)
MIVSSAILDDAQQIDGRRWIAERHTDHLGLVYEFRYLCAAVTDAAALMAARVASINADLTAREIAANIAAVSTLGSQAVPTFSYSTTAQNVAALRAAYASATQTQAIFTGEYLGSLTDAQLQSAFGLTAGQVTTLRANKLTSATTAANTIRAASGLKWRLHPLRSTCAITRR